MTILSVVLLIIGFVIRVTARDGHGHGPLWGAREAFATQQAYTRYVVGTSCIVIGFICLVVSLLR